jgi:hypothetical protein
MRIQFISSAIKYPRVTLTIMPATPTEKLKERIIFEN